MKALDLFCGAGGASKGLEDSGLFSEIVGVDIKDQPNYPYKIITDNVFDLCFWDICKYDFIWASPPCQHYTRMLNHGQQNRNKYPDLIQETRSLLERTGKPYVIENVIGAPLIKPIMLCGEMFGLRVTRHRIFESSHDHIKQPKHKKYKGTHIRKQNDGGYYYRVYGHETGKRNWGKAMGINWMRSCELTQAIPPAYSKYIVEELFRP